MKTIRMALIILLVLSISAIAYAATSDALQHKPGMKAERGVKNILFGWTDIPKSIIQVTKDSKNPIWGLTAGTLKGVGKALPRTLSGIADVATFPISTHDKPYEKSLINPDELNTKIQ